MWARFNYAGMKLISIDLLANKLKPNICRLLTLYSGKGKEHLPRIWQMLILSSLSFSLSYYSTFLLVRIYYPSTPKSGSQRYLRSPSFCLLPNQSASPVKHSPPLYMKSGWVVAGSAVPVATGWWRRDKSTLSLHSSNSYMFICCAEIQICCPFVIIIIFLVVGGWWWCLSCSAIRCHFTVASSPFSFLSDRSIASESGG